MIHLDYLPHQQKFKGYNLLIKKAIDDLKNLEEGGVDAVMIENWKDESSFPFVNKKSIEAMTKISKIIVKKTALPVGINVLPNDYKSAFSIAKAEGLQFVQLDVFVDKVKTDYSYSKVLPFEINLDLKDFKKFRKQIKAENIILLVTIQPKHYIMLEEKKLEQSAKQALQNGADAVIITGKVTGKPPSAKQIKKVKKSVNCPIMIGSGLTKENAKSLLKYSDGAIVGTAFKTKDFEKVLKNKVKNLMNEVKNNNYDKI